MAGNSKDKVRDVMSVDGLFVWMEWKEEEEGEEEKRTKDRLFK